MISPSFLSKNSCCAVRDHIGKFALDEICHLPGRTGKGRTHTLVSYCPPDPVPTRYAIQRPSGENAGRFSPAGELRKASGFWSFGWSGSLRSNGSIQMSEPVPALTE